MSRHAKEVPLTHMIRCISRATPASEGLSPGRLRRARSRPSERPRHQLGGDLRLSFRYAGVQFVPLAMVSGATNNDCFSGTKICSQRTPPSDRRSLNSRDEGKSSQAAMNTMLATDLVRQDRHESRLPAVVDVKPPSTLVTWIGLDRSMSRTGFVGTRWPIPGAVGSPAAPSSPVSACATARATSTSSTPARRRRSARSTSPTRRAGRRRGPRGPRRSRRLRCRSRRR
jgi:hypothetical protein